MAEKRKNYTLKFSSELIKKAYKNFLDYVGDHNYSKNEWVITNIKDETWTLDSEDEFLISYKEEIKSAHFSNTFYGDTIQHSFSVWYSKRDKEDSTSISISLPSRSDIETIFSFFEQAEEKYNINISSKSISKPKKTFYSIRHELPACLVNSKLLSDIENYLLRKRDLLMSITEEKKWNYRIALHDSYGSEILSSIEQFNSINFPDNLKEIVIINDSHSGNEIRINFGLRRNSSIIKISIRSENSREIVEGIKAEIFQILRNYKTKTEFFNPSLNIELSMILFSAIISPGTVAILYSINKQLNQYTISLLLLSVMFGIYFIFKQFKPYNIFDTKKNIKQEQWSSWLFFSLLEFIIFTFIGGLLLREFFGF